MRTLDFLKIGVPKGECLVTADQAFRAAKRAGRDERAIRDQLKRVVRRPDRFVEHELFGELANALIARQGPRPAFAARSQPAPYRIWGSGFEEGALKQMANACALPVSVMGALMPDAHQGYGLPIGGVLATDQAVIPYAVGMDIACRMKMTVIDRSLADLATNETAFRHAIENETRFGVGAEFKKKREHAVMDRDWKVSPLTDRLKGKAWAQLGTSGSGNHFVEFGRLTVSDAALGLPEGEYLALLSHSGSRGTGGEIAKQYSGLARREHPELPRELEHLAWLDLRGALGQEYWAAMELMGHYAAANHELIHRHIVQALGAQVLLTVENHHNFAWREVHRLPDGTEREVIVHRKGATPAAQGVIGIIPGSMGTPGYVVRGKGEAASLHSAAHGAGRRMSRTKARQQYSWKDVGYFLEQRGVKVISAGLDEVPMAYKNIGEVMAAQADLVEPLAKFEPRLVKMSPGDDPPED
ncbi:MAG: RtcB family protein [Vicinamibacteria bacterium]|jgi:tRNA-splicing ligase RtcB|nr:RtcB family protein [Vicinamibacteria bacterium]